MIIDWNQSRGVALYNWLTNGAEVRPFIVEAAGITLCFLVHNREAKKQYKIQVKLKRKRTKQLY